eukprot:TRINITY_DN8214_c1_g1_i2.p1 TRINITY_DN8214_c1_g1~~TRINITY_DN8214_c1_g1_i2.p1  ORF type:complete len:203 (-),score=30.62 TRINITY_DN8214_c1_g1_i2:47-655(-)
MQDLKDQFKKLDSKKQQIEQELDVRYARLLGPNGAGLTGNLVDAEGYPRGDIDILAVRQDRQRVSELKNDLKVVMDQISDLLEKIHGTARENGEVKSAQSTQENSNYQNQSQRYVPFAKVDEVAENSPASQAGVRVGDELCVFGSVTYSSSNHMALVAKELQDNEDKVVTAIFLRNGKVIQVGVTPRKWSGRGLFGCHIVPK